VDILNHVIRDSMWQQVARGGPWFYRAQVEQLALELLEVRKVAAQYVAPNAPEYGGIVDDLLSCSNGTSGDAAKRNTRRSRPPTGSKRQRSSGWQSLRAR
jgi:hypothetical protein